MSEMNERQEIVPQQPPAEVRGGPLDVGPDGAARPRFWTNLPRASRDQRALITRCMAEGSLDKDKVCGERFDLAGVLVHSVRLMDRETGEVQERVRCVLARADGHTAAFVSDGIFKGIALVLMLEGGEAWERPVPVVIHKVRLPVGHTYNLEMLPDEPPAAPAGKGAGRGK